MAFQNGVLNGVLGHVLCESSFHRSQMVSQSHVIRTRKVSKCINTRAHIYIYIYIIMYNIYIYVCVYTRICACWGSPAEEWLSLLASPSQEGHTNSWSIPCEMSDIKQNQRGCFFWFGVLQVLQGEQNTRTWWFQLTPCRTKPKTNMVLLNQTAE